MSRSRATTARPANDKANELLFHLALATISIVLLIGFAIGWREAGVTLIVIPTTILLTLFAANVMGYTINRVSLFALIFSIGILVDDAIVVVENIARHWAMNDQRTRMQAAIEAVAEVGNPDRRRHAHRDRRAAADAVRLRHDGPLYGADPGQCLGGDAVLLLRRHGDRALGASEIRRQGHGRAAGRASHRRPAGRVLPAHGRAHRALRRRTPSASCSMSPSPPVAVCMLFVTETVTVKLLPFDNKSELEVMVDLPEGATVEDTSQALFEAARVTEQLPEVKSIQAYAGTPAPFNFNGLVRHYYLRTQPEMGELQVNLYDKADRDRESHAIAHRSAQAARQAEDSPRAR